MLIGGTYVLFGLLYVPDFPIYSTELPLQSEANCVISKRENEHKIAI